MSEKQDKRVRREVRTVLRNAGALPEQVGARKPGWMPMGLWIRLYHWVMHGTFALHPPTTTRSRAGRHP
jgi:hypothetical protein